MHRVRRRRPIGDFARMAAGKDTDKESRHQYGAQYDFVFSKAFRDSVQTVLELGVHQGGSLRLWEEYFPNASIVGVDINPDATEYASERSTVVIADQADKDALDEALEDGTFDVIIDDASHVFTKTRASYEILWGRVKNGGWYVIEDLETSGKPRLYGGDPMLGPDTSMSGYLARIANGLMAYDVVRKRRWFPTARVVSGPNITFLQRR